MEEQILISETEFRMYLERSFLRGHEFANTAKYTSAEEYAKNINKWKEGLVNQLVNEAKLQEELRKANKD